MQAKKKLLRLTREQFKLIMWIRVDPDYTLSGGEMLIATEMVKANFIKRRKKGKYEVTKLGNKIYLSIATTLDLAREEAKKQTVAWQKKYGNRMIPLVKMLKPPPSPEPIALIQDIVIRRATRSFKQYVWTLQKLEEVEKVQKQYHRNYFSSWL